MSTYTNITFIELDEIDTILVREFADERGLYTEEEDA